MHTDVLILSLSLRHCFSFSLSHPMLNFFCLSHSHLTSPPLLSIQLLFFHSVPLTLFILCLVYLYSCRDLFHPLLSLLVSVTLCLSIFLLLFHHFLSSLSFFISIKTLQSPNCSNRLAALVSKFGVVAAFHSCPDKQMRGYETCARK